MTRVRATACVLFLISVMVPFVVRARVTQPSNVRAALPEAAQSFELRLAQKTAAKGLTPAVQPSINRRIYLHPTAIVTHRDVVEARAVRGRFDPSFNVEVKFTAEGSRRLANATRRHVGRPVAILINGRVVAAPVLKGVISDTAMISGTFTRQEAERLAAELIALVERPRPR